MTRRHDPPSPGRPRRLPPATPAATLPATLAAGLALVCGLLAGPTPARAEDAPAPPIVELWRYTTERPDDGWPGADFDASTWQEAHGGFGTANTPGARVGTPWTTEDIWLRKTVDLAGVPASPALLIHHDDEAEVFLNGEPIVRRTGYTTGYVVVPIPEEKRSALTTGANVLAVHAHQASGGQFIDVHLIDADAVPTLPPPTRNTKPFVSELITTWGADVTPENAWTEYPRPQMARDDWTCLNGHWDYAITDDFATAVPTEWAGRILVPFALESKLSGVQRLLDPSEALWYRRTFTVDAAPGERTRLTFEAVDYRCSVTVNGTWVGSHAGGHTPFTFDVTDALRPGENELVVRVEDETEGWQLRGKQVLNARGIWYTQVSGIWQTVWLETVPATHIDDVGITTDAAAGTITVRTVPSGIRTLPVRIVVKDGDAVVAEKVGGTIVPLGDDGSRHAETLTIPDAKLWSPQSPHLYTLEISLLDEDKTTVLDRVTSYAGIRTVGKAKDDDGHWRFTLNGQTVFPWGPLDQGWWPDGLLTPPSDEAMLFDIEYLKAAGFNMIRKHIKVEPRRYYYHCDRLGMMVWQDQVSGGADPRWTRLQPDPADADWPAAHHRQFMTELARMIDHLEDHPSIVSWVPFNEAWGQHDTVAVGDWVAERDPSRTVNIASGGNFWPAGDVVDEHRYPHPGFPFHLGPDGRFDHYIKVVGEFGGHGYPVPGHLWDAGRRNWGYGGLPKSEAEYKQRYVTSLDRLNVLRARGIAAGVYTQTTDVEGEINGLMTYDRKVVKMPAEELATLHARLFAPPPTVTPEDLVIDMPGQAESPEALRDGLTKHDRALHIKAGWIRDPYITLAPDGYYYLTGTTPEPLDERQAADPYNTGLGKESIVGHHVRLWRSRDLIAWESLGEPFGLTDGYWATKQPGQFAGEDRTGWHLWAPEVHFVDGRWILVHTSPGPVKQGSNVAVTAGPDLRGPYTFPLGDLAKGRHDPSIFRDDDGTVYLLWGNTMIAPLTDDLSGFAAEPVRIDPAGSRPGPDGEPISRIGHEGATLRKIGGKYVLFGTAWSTDVGRKGSYNLYYCTADKPTGPYGPRRFCGRFLGHGTPFQDKDGRWWCTAFFNANVPPLPKQGIAKRDLGEDAQTINDQGVTIVPLEVRTKPDGDVTVRAIAPLYRSPGPDEAQKFEPDAADARP